MADLDYPVSLRYSRDHEWVATTDDNAVVRVGITDFAQEQLGDVVYVDLPEAGDSVTAGESCGEVESTKSVSDLIAPVSGTVTEIGLVYTKLKTIDNKSIFIPNGEISGEKIINYNKQEQRRVDLTFTVSYDADPERVKEIMRQVIGAHPKALFTPEPFVRTTSLGESSVGYTLRVWCATQDYWELYYDLLEQVRAAFDREGVELTYNHLNVHIMKE